MKINRNDFFVGIFVIATVGTVIAALVATSGWGVQRWDVYVHSDNVRDIAVDTKIYLQGLEVGRVAGIAAQPGLKAGRLEFVIHTSLLAEFSDGKPLELPRSTAMQVETQLLGGSRLNLVQIGDRTGMIQPGDTIEMVRLPEAIQALGGLATDLKGTIQEALTTTIGTLRAFQRLADSLTLATGTARRFVQGVQPGTEQILADASAGMRRVTRLLDTADVRSGVTLGEVDATIRQARRVMVSADSLTRLLATMGGENRPAVREIMDNARLLSEQMLFVMEQLSRRPARFMTGMTLPDSLTAEGRRRPCPAGDTTCARSP